MMSLPPPFLFVPLAVHYATSFHRMPDALDGPQGSPHTQHELCCRQLEVVCVCVQVCAGECARLPYIHQNTSSMEVSLQLCSQGSKTGLGS